MRWITFDQETCSSLHAARPWENTFEFPGRTALQYALESKNIVVAVLPAARSEAAIATFRKKGIAMPDRVVVKIASLPNKGITRTDSELPAGGILGLRDEPDFSGDEETPEKRNLWRRFWDY